MFSHESTYTGSPKVTGLLIGMFMKELPLTYRFNLQKTLSLSVLEKEDI